MIKAILFFSFLGGLCILGFRSRVSLLAIFDLILVFRVVLVLLRRNK